MNNLKWQPHHFSGALVKAIEAHAHPRFLRRQGDKILFNGFWRDGDKQNVCAWPEKGTWHDAKTGEGGDVKEFARIAFDMDLVRFMDSFGDVSAEPSAWSAAPVLSLECDLNAIWSKLESGKAHASAWLESQRGINTSAIQHFFADISAAQALLFPEPICSFLKRLLHNGPALISPLINPETERIVNFLIRFIDKRSASKAVFLPGLPIVADGVPCGFGLPHLYVDFPEIILCEGLTDTLAATALTEDNEKVLVIGAPSAQQLPLWGRWLAEHYQGTVSIIYHLDKHDHDISINGTGQQNALKAMSNFCNLPAKASLFSWSRFLTLLEEQGIPNPFNSIFDLADACQRADRAVVRECFEQTFKESLNG